MDEVTKTAALNTVDRIFAAAVRVRGMIERGESMEDSRLPEGIFSLRDFGNKVMLQITVETYKPGVRDAASTISPSVQKGEMGFGAFEVDQPAKKHGAETWTLGYRHD